MYSYNDFKHLFLRYKLEGVPSGVLIEKFCMSNRAPFMGRAVLATALRAEAFHCLNETGSTGKA